MTDEQNLDEEPLESADGDPDLDSELEGSDPENTSEDSDIDTEEERDSGPDQFSQKATGNDVGGNLNIAGRDIIQAFGEVSRFHSVGPEELERIAHIFVEPPGFEKQSKQHFTQILSERVAIIHGQEGSGRLTTSLALARELLRREAPRNTAGRVVRCAKKAGQDDLHELVRLASTKNASVLVLEDALGMGIGPDELQNPLLSTLRTQLTEHALFLILTTGPKSRGQGLNIPQISTSRLNLKKVFEKALGAASSASIDELEEELRDSAGLSKSFTKPVHVDRFFAKLANLEKIPPKEARASFVRRLAKEASTTGALFLERWFDDLNLEERLWAFLIAFFGNAPLHQLIDLNEVVVNDLRKKDLGLVKDPLALQVNPILQRLNARRMADLVDWEEEYRDFVLGSPVVFHKVLLLRTAYALLENLDLLLGFRNPSLRLGLGKLLGLLGRAYPRDIRKRLDELAKGEWGHGTIAAYAVRELVGEEDQVDRDSESGDENTQGAREREKFLNLAQRIMSDWAKSQFHRRRWTAASAAWQSYEGVKDSKNASRSFSFLLKTVAFDKLPSDRLWQDQGKKTYDSCLWSARYSASFAIARWLSQSVEESDGFMDQLRHRWLTDDSSSDKHQVALHGLAQFIEETRARPRLSPQTANQVLQLVSLAKSPDDRYGASFFTQAFRNIFSHLADRWLKTGVGQELLSGASRDLSTRLPETQRRRWTDHVTSYWTAGPEGRLAEMVRARASAVEGRFINPPPTDSALVIIDPDLLFIRRPRGGGEKQNRSKEPQISWNDAAAAWIRRLCASVSRCWHWQGALLGRTDRFDALEDLFEHEKALEGHGQALHPHALASPCLEHLKVEPKLILVITRRSVDDLADLYSHDFLGKTLVLKASADWAESEGPTIRFTSTEDPAAWAAWMDWIEGVGINESAKQVPSSWEPFLDMARLPRTASSDQVWHLLDNLEERWDFSISDEDEEDPDSSVDILRIGCGLVGWLASHDLSECCRSLAERLNRLEPQEDLWASDDAAPPFVRWAALAGARFLFRLHRDSPFQDEFAYSWMYTNIDETSEKNSQGLKDLFDYLAPALAKADPIDGPTTVLRSVERWLQDPDWVDFLGSDIQDGQGRLARWAQVYAPDSLASLTRDLPEVYPPEARTLWNGVTLRPPGKSLSIPDLSGEREKYGLVVLSNDEPVNRRVATGLVRLLEERYPDIEPLIFQIGRAAPVWIRGEAQAYWATTPCPPLLFPLLEKPRFEPNNIAFILVLGKTEILDSRDLTESVWQSRLLRFDEALGRPGMQGPAPWSLRRLAHEPLAQATESYLPMLGQALEETLLKSSAPWEALS